MSLSPFQFPISRRAALSAIACGFGQLALSALASAPVVVSPSSARVPHLAPKVKRVIFLFMQGGPSQVDTFDYKPRINQDDGKKMPFDDPRTVANTGARGTDQRVMGSPWKFKQHGASGRWVSELFPHMAQHVDDLCFIHSMQTEGVAHGPATLFLHCGSTNFVRPSMGSWISYGLGSANENLPAFVTLCPALGNGGPRNYGNAFLPTAHQGLAIGRAEQSVKTIGIRDLAKGGPAAHERLDLLQRLNAEQVKARPGAAELEAVISNYELAWRMQMNAPSVLDLTQESAATLAMYGIGEEPTDDYGRQCLMARRLCEAGVRFVQVTYGDNTANPRWDQHSNLPKHADHARAVDKPIAGLLADLKQRGLLEDTLIWWGSEFGRTPYAERNGTGRDHNPLGFTVWLAGAGVKHGLAYGETDEFGQRAVVNKVHMHDLHATILHLLGLDHEKLTFRHDGRDYRLTDVHGHVVTDILA
ncbi:MAG TPA: DUF1501 domain-containing protein [Methylomirabilota bacterium]|nr:DUF1501 domain-containing protein [Methylomirabilota bacterium]